MDALDLILAGRFDEAIKLCKTAISHDLNNIAAIDGLSKAYQGAGDFRAAIPFIEQVHRYQTRATPNTSGQQHDLAAAYWCIGDWELAMKLVYTLCVGVLDKTIGMAPDPAGGATFGLMLHYMAVTKNDVESRDYALNYLKKLNLKYHKQPKFYHYPVETVRQTLGELEFEDALEAATTKRSLVAAYRASEERRSARLALGVALFYDGVMHRVYGDEVSFLARMQQVNQLGHQTEPICWYFARVELERAVES